MRIILIIFSEFIIASCSTYYQLHSLGGLSSMPSRNAWVRNGQYISFYEMKLCREYADSYKNVNDYTLSSKIYFDCIYQKGYRFKPEVGYCSYWKDTYICKNASKYK
ncbi:hypothetical protein P7L95_09765 [Bisgaard Taxon 10/6]|uniref:hypothetical protein n=1 Tax=Exercitatus varius TaxID=67857 RepID=UPI0018A3CC25|nr:hypothetical protein [Exercitatus varius]QOF67475.1 hypothetical protein IFE17_10185 [Actinobacillus sp. GY-402]MDG2957028.1 hypothetical protein [Exercitatus varius]MDG2959160.1 hypothetical protein [Exercitatus varius]MDG2963368.1 hypothetical protein [Exercitatus varius]MDG2964651.1 hypothetical protein [Exercitatus varius]